MKAGSRFCRFTVFACFLVAMPELVAQEGMNPEERRHPEITIWVYNYADAPQQTIASTKREVSRILSQAGVVTRWKDCPVSSAETEDQPSCEERMLPSELAIMIFHKFKLANGVSRDSHLG